MPAAVLPAHRLRLSAAELAAVLRACPVTLPPGFTTANAAAGAAAAGAGDDDGCGGGDEDTAVRRAAVGLAARGVLIGGADAGAAGGWRVVPAVAANLAALAAPAAAVRVEAAVAGRGLRAYFGVSGSVGASMFALGDGAVEVSMFPAVGLGRELTRAVPGSGDVCTPQARIGAALGGARIGSVAGQLPLSALSRMYPGGWHADAAWACAAAGTVPVTAAEAALAARVTEAASGTLWCLASGADGRGGVLTGQVVWLATNQGWVGLRPEPDGSGRRMVGLVAVAREDLGTWLAPYLAQILEVAS